MTEEWRPIPGYDLYDVSSLGRIRSWAVRGWMGRRAATAKIRWPVKSNDGHLRIQLGKGGPHFGVHCLVALAFHGPRPSREVCRHLNGISDDNRAENLVWGTLRENGQDAHAHGAMSHGSDHAAAKLNDDAVRLIRTSSESVSALARRFQVSRKAIAQARSGRTWTHVCVGERA